MIKALFLLTVLFISIVAGLEARAQGLEACGRSCTPECMRKIDRLRALVAESDNNCGAMVDNLTCTPGINNRNLYFLRRLDNEQSIGEGFNTLAECNLARTYRTAGVMCTPGKNNRNLFFIRRISDEEALGQGFKNLNECVAGIGNNQYLTGPELVCTPGVNRADQFFVRRVDNADSMGSGFKRIEDCGQALNTRTQNFICTPGLQDYNLFFIRNIETQKSVGGGFKNLEDCTASLR